MMSRLTVSPQRLVARAVALCFFLPLGLSAAIAGVITFPQPLYPYQITAGRLSLHSDQPIDPVFGPALLAEADARLRLSSLNREDGSHRVFISNTRWRERLTFVRGYGVIGGFNYYPLTRNVFLRAADLQAGLLISPLGTPVQPPRTLAYFVTHEIAHTFTGERLGLFAYFRLPIWLREGVADYIAFAGTGVDDLDAMARLYLAGDDPAYHYEQSGLYTRYRFLVSYLIERMGYTVEGLLDRPMRQEDAEALVRGRLAARSS